MQDLIRIVKEKPKTDQLKPESSPPWQRTLYIMSFAQVMTAVGYSSIFPFLPLYVEDLGSALGVSLELLAGLVFSAQAFMMMLASPFWGAIADRYGRKLMVQRSLYGGTVLLLMMAFVRSAEELVLLRTVQGLVTGTVAAANALVAAEVPRKRMGYAMGMLQVALGAGLALGPLVGGLVADSFNYATAFYVTSAMLLLAGLLVQFGVHEQFTPTRLTAERGRVGFVDGWRHVLGAYGVRITYGMRFLSQMGRMMIIPIAPLLIQSLMPGSGRVNTFTGLVFGLSSATTTLSAIFLGRLGDRIGHRVILIASLIGGAVLYLPQGFATAAWHLLVLQALVGISIGGIIPSISALLAMYTQPGEEGAVYGLDNSINAGGRSIAPLLGAGVAAVFNLRATFAATALIYFLAGGLAFWLLPKANKPSQE